MSVRISAWSAMAGAVLLVLLAHWEKQAGVKSK